LLASNNFKDLKTQVPLSYQEDSIAQGFQGYSSPFSISQRKSKKKKTLVTLLEMQVA
jgi:hypothetical protein